MVKIYSLNNNFVNMPHTITISSKTALEGGVYTLKEAAMYAKISTQRLKQWYLGDAKTNRVFDNDELIEDGAFINFLDFVQALGVRELRVNHKVPLIKIREAIKCAQDQYGIKYPFACEHKTYSDNRKIYIQIKDDLIQLTSPHTNQFTMKKIVEYYIKELTFNEQGYAHQYRPAEGILLDPTKRFGEPLLEKTGLTAIAIYDSVLAEGDFDVVADLYEINVRDVQNAYKYIYSLKQAA